MPTTMFAFQRVKNYWDVQTKKYVWEKISFTFVALIIKD